MDSLKNKVLKLAQAIKTQVESSTKGNAYKPGRELISGNVDVSGTILKSARFIAGGFVVGSSRPISVRLSLEYVVGEELTPYQLVLNGEVIKIQSLMTLSPTLQQYPQKLLLGHNNSHHVIKIATGELSGESNYLDLVFDRHKEDFGEWHKALCSAWTETIFAYTFHKQKIGGSISMRAIEGAIKQCESMYAASDHSSVLRAKKIWNIKVEIHTVLNSLTTDPLQFSQETLYELISKAEREQVLFWDEELLMVKRIAPRAFSSLELQNIHRKQKANSVTTPPDNMDYDVACSEIQATEVKCDDDDYSPTLVQVTSSPLTDGFIPSQTCAAQRDVDAFSRSDVCCTLFDEDNHMYLSHQPQPLPEPQQQQQTRRPRMATSSNILEAAISNPATFRTSPKKLSKQSEPLQQICQHERQQHPIKRAPRYESSHRAKPHYRLSHQCMPPSKSQPDDDFKEPGSSQNNENDPATGNMSGLRQSEHAEIIGISFVAPLSNETFSENWAKTVNPTNPSNINSRPASPEFELVQASSATTSPDGKVVASVGYKWQSRKRICFQAAMAELAALAPDHSHAPKILSEATCTPESPTNIPVPAVDYIAIDTQPDESNHTVSTEKSIIVNPPTELLHSPEHYFDNSSPLTNEAQHDADIGSVTPSSPTNTTNPAVDLNSSFGHDDAIIDYIYFDQQKTIIIAAGASSETEEEFPSLVSDSLRTTLTWLSLGNRLHAVKLIGCLLLLLATICQKLSIPLVFVHWDASSDVWDMHSVGGQSSQHVDNYTSPAIPYRTSDVTAPLLSNTYAVPNTTGSYVIHTDGATIATMMWVSINDTEGTVEDVAGYPLENEVLDVVTEPVWSTTNDVAVTRFGEAASTSRFERVQVVDDPAAAMLTTPLSKPAFTRSFRALSAWPQQYPRVGSPLSQPPRRWGIHGWRGKLIKDDIGTEIQSSARSLKNTKSTSSKVNGMEAETVSGTMVTTSTVINQTNRKAAARSSLHLIMNSMVPRFKSISWAYLKQLSQGVRIEYIGHLTGAVRQSLLSLLIRTKERMLGCLSANSRAVMYKNVAAVATAAMERGVAGRVINAVHDAQGHIFAIWHAYNNYQPSHTRWTDNP
jgi:hypothetical protein